jgi:hypothetical protein
MSQKIKANLATTTPRPKSKKITIKQIKKLLTYLSGVSACFIFSILLSMPSTAPVEATQAVVINSCPESGCFTPATSEWSAVRTSHTSEVAPTTPAVEVVELPALIEQVAPVVVTTVIPTPVAVKQIVATTSTKPTPVVAPVTTPAPVAVQAVVTPAFDAGQGNPEGVLPAGYVPAVVKTMPEPIIEAQVKTPAMSCVILESGAPDCQGK